MLCEASMRKKYDEEIITHHQGGLTNKKIAELLNIDPDTVASRLKKFGLKSNFREPIQLIDENTAQCKKCGQLKSINEFSIQRKSTVDEYRLAYCNICRREQEKQAALKRSDTIDKYLSVRYNELIRRSRRELIGCLITEDEFITQYHNQNGLCFYTDISMICEVGNGKHRYGLSIDKIIPEKGYVNGNVVFCLNKINTCKNDLTLDEIKLWMPRWHERIENFLNERRK
jgi:hypothetical protein